MKTLSTLIISSSFCILEITSSFVCAHEQDGERTFDMLHNTGVKEGHLHLGWESRYVSEGRDNLDGDSLVTTSAEYSWNWLTAGVWYGGSPDQSYDEFQLSLGLTHSIGDFEYYLAYTHLRSPQDLRLLFDDNYDNEMGVGVVWSGLPVGLEFTLDAYYSFKSDGSFWEIALNREFEISDCLTISGMGIFGVNQGYVSDGHDGANNVAFLAELQYALSETLTFNAHAAYTWALERDASLAGDELLRDTFHGGVGMQWVF